MADKSIDQLNPADNIYATDMFVLQQSGTAKKLTGQILLNWLTAAADGHGGIHSIQKLSTNALADTYRITLADKTTFDFVVTNGRGITEIKKTSTSGLVDTYTISYNNGTSSTFKVTNGAKGDKGDNTYTWIKYASQEPTEASHSMGDLPDKWIGFYAGGASVAPTDWKQYKWYKIKGDTGDTGSPATLMNGSVTYQVSDSGTITPSGAWSSTVPVVEQGRYLWTRTVTQFNTGNAITAYSVSRMGINGSGAVSTVCKKEPDASGNVSLAAGDVGALPSSGGTMTGPIELAAPTDATHAVNKAYTDLAAYPVGAIYLSVTDTSPAALFGGSWEQLKDQFLLGAGDTYSAGSTGGESEHTLTQDEMPKHFHGAYLLGMGGTATTPAYYAALNQSAYTYNYELGVSDVLESAIVGPKGGGTSHNNMPPYLAVYMWKRVA